MRGFTSVIKNTGTKFMALLVSLLVGMTMVLATGPAAAAGGNKVAIEKPKVVEKAALPGEIKALSQNKVLVFPVVQDAVKPAAKSGVVVVRNPFFFNRFFFNPFFEADLFIGD
jgi:hypothetical protein